MYGARGFGVRAFGQRGYPHYGCGDAEDSSHHISRLLVATSALEDYSNPVYDSNWTHLGYTDGVGFEWEVPDGRLQAGLGYCSRVGYRPVNCCDELWSDPCCWIQPGVPVVCPSYPPLKRVEIWTDLECADGVKLWHLSRHGDANAFYGCQTLDEVAGREENLLDLQRDSDAWDHIQSRRVVRTVYGREPDNSDEVWREWRLQDDADGRQPDDSLWGRIKGVGVRYDLGDRTLTWKQANGTVLLSWSLFNLPITDHLDFILRRAAERGLDWLEAGTIEDNPTARYDLDYGNASVLGLLGRLAELAHLELDIVPVTDEDGRGTSYAIHMLTQIGQTCGRPEIRYRKNLLSIQRERKTEDFAPRVYPVGGEQDSVRLTIAGAQWTIVSVDEGTRRVFLGDAPILYDDQLNNLYAEVVGSSGLRHLVEDTDATDQYVALASLAGVSAGQALIFREDAEGTELTWLQNPASVALHGEVAPPQDPVELPFVDNLAPNAFLSVIEGIDDPSPQDWFAIGPTPAELSINTDQAFFQHGSSSLHVDAPAAGDGVESGWVPIFPTETRPFFSLQVRLWVVSGSVQLELVIDTGDTEITFPDPGGGTLAFTTRTGVWVEDLGIGGLDLYEAGARFAKIRLKAKDGAAEWYLDAVTLSQTAGGVEAHFEGLASNQLWHAGNRMLALRSEPEVSYDVPLADLTRLDGSRWPFDELVKGANALVHDDDPLGVDQVLRITKIERNELNEGETRVTLAKTPEALTRFLGQERTGTRRAISRVGSGGRPTDGGDGDNPHQGALSSFSVVRQEIEGDWYHLLSWAHNDVIQNDGSYTLTISERVYVGGTLEEEAFVAVGRDPRLDTVAFDLFPRAGSMRLGAPYVEGGGGSSVEATYLYGITLLKDDVILIQTLSATIAGTYDVGT